LKFNVIKFNIHLRLYFHPLWAIFEDVINRLKSVEQEIFAGQIFLWVTIDSENEYPRIEMMIISLRMPVVLPLATLVLTVGQIVPLRLKGHHRNAVILGRVRVGIKKYLRFPKFGYLFCIPWEFPSNVFKKHLLPVTQCFVLLRIFLKIPLFEG
jgi:hypothetical protein